MTLQYNESSDLCFIKGHIPDNKDTSLSDNGHQPGPCCLCFISLKGFYGCQRILFRSFSDLFHLFFIRAEFLNLLGRNERVIGAHSVLTLLAALTET